MTFKLVYLIATIVLLIGTTGVATAANATEVSTAAKDPSDTNLMDIFDREAVKKSAIDSVKSINEGGIVNMILGLCAAGWILSILVVVLIGGGKWAAGKKEGNTNETNSGRDMVICAICAGVAVPVALLIIGLAVGTI